MSRFLSFFILFFLTTSSVIAQNNCDGCPEYSDVATGSGSVCSGETYIMTVANEACEGAIYFNLNVKVTFGGSWQLKGPSGTIIDGGAEGYNKVDGNYEINEDYGPFCESDGTVFTVSSNQGQFGTTTMDISQEGSIIQTVIVKGTLNGGAGSGSGTFTPAPVNSPATITVTTPSGDITQTVNNCEDFSIDVPFNEINYCTTVAVDLPWEIKCDSTNAVISSGIHNVVILPKEPTLAEDIVNISWNNNTCSWDVSTNNDCDILDIGNIFTISPDPSTTATQDICESGNQIFTIEYLGIANQEFCPSGEAGNLEINAIYTGCGPDEPVITLTDPTCVSDGSAMLGNYDNTLTYSFSPAGPTIDGTGNINGANADVNYTLTVSNGQCESTADFTIESQYQAPTIEASADLTTVCTGSPVTLTGNGGVTYSWEDGLNNTVGTAETITVSPTVTTTYTVTGEDINGCTNTDEITIGVTQKIDPEFDNVVSICTGETLADLPTISNDGITGTWSPAINNTQTTTYTFVPTADQCANEFSLTIEVVQNPDEPAITITDPTCVSDGSAMLGNYDNTLTYSFSPAGPTIDGTGNINGVNADVNYTLTVSNGQCESTSDFTIEAILEVPTISAQATNPDFCGGNGTINFTFTGVPDGSYIIEYDGGSFMNVQVVNGEASVSTIAGEYNNIFIDNGDCISNLVDISITNPTTNFNGENPFDIEINPFDPIVPAGEQVDLNVYVEPSVQVTQILWFPAEGLSCIDCASPTASPEQTTTYYVEVTNSQGCTAIDSVTVTIDAACGDILVPTHFSPNNDGLNDRLCVLGNCITFLEFEIYDRWGELVFYSTDQKDCWDGTYKGLPAQTGVYVFTMRAGIFNGEEIIKTGTVTLMR